MLIDPSYPTSTAAKQVISVAREHNGYVKRDKNSNSLHLISSRFEKAAWPMYPPFGDKERQIPVRVSFRPANRFVDMSGLITNISGLENQHLFIPFSVQRYVRVWPVELVATVEQPHRLVVFYMDFGGTEVDANSSSEDGVQINVIVFDSLKRESFLAMQQRINMLQNENQNYAIIDSLQFEEQSPLLRAQVQVDLERDILPWTKKMHVRYLHPGARQDKETDMFNQLADLGLKRLATLTSL